ncbi:MAG TPA: alpha-amylase family glycosyl hydrolase [Chitinophagaceae bacterium]
MAKLFPTVGWARGSNVYEVNIRQYTAGGTFAGFAAHIPRLAEMGVEILWLMPVTPISLEKRQGSLGSYYACSSYTEVNPEFGGADDLRELVRTAHAHGMRVIIDWVANHTGWDHHWTKAHPDWYLRDEDGMYFDANGWADVIDLDYSNEAMRKEMIRCMQFWIDSCDIDGFRCDMAHLVPLDFWQQARVACDSMKPLFWLAETDNGLYHEVFDATYAWSWMHMSERYMKGEADLAAFTRELRALNELPPDCSKLLFTSNHDENSWNGTEYEKYGDGARAMAVLCCTAQAMPLVYSGQEVPNTRRLKFFDKDQLDWNEPVLAGFYRSLLLLRRHSNAARYGETAWLDVEGGERVIAFVRLHEQRAVLVLINLSATDKLRVRVKGYPLTGTWSSAFSGLHFHFDAETVFELGAWGYLVYQK